MTTRAKLTWMLAALGIGTSACATDPGTANKTSTSQRTRILRDANHSGVLREVDPVPGKGNLILSADDGGMCPVMSWTETTTVVTDSEGNVLSSTTTVCTQCFEADGTTPIGDPVCTDDPMFPVDTICTDRDSVDPTLACYECVDASGTIVDDECYPLPVTCVTDADCPMGEVCYVDGGGVIDPPPPLPGDPTDPMDPGGNGTMDPTAYRPDILWAKAPGAKHHVPAKLARHAKPNRTPIAQRKTRAIADMVPPDGGMGGTGYCAQPDPCIAVPSLPSDPTGVGCWQCTDPSTGEDLGSWCDVHACGEGGSCVNPWETCDPDGSGFCIWIDPCVAVPDGSAWGDTTGSDCWQCTDPATGEDWGGWCNAHTCSADADCAAYGEGCVDGTCEWVDPCTPAMSVPEDPTGVNCYTCADPMSPDGVGYGYCIDHTCATDGDCVASGWGNVCLGGLCATE